MTSPVVSSPFHRGERAVQEQAMRAEGASRARIETMGQRIIRDFMPPPHRELFAKLPWLHVGSIDDSGQPWASVVVGAPGFLSTPDDRTLRVNASPLPGDRLAARLRLGAPVGLLGLEPRTRRRNRVNGRIVAQDAAGFTVHVEQSFGNCPKYIQARELAVLTAEERPSPSPAVVLGPALDEAARALLRASDTVFLATAHAEAAAPAAPAHDETTAASAFGVDVSHRGGKPGFLRLDRLDRAGSLRIVLPDFSGNFMFQSLGNLATEPRAGLLAVDYRTGDVLSLAVEGRVLWEGPDLEAFEGAERVVHLEVTAGLWLPRACPLRGSRAEEAPELEDLGAWR